LAFVAYSLWSGVAHMNFGPIRRNEQPAMFRFSITLCVVLAAVLLIIGFI
jgi:hypothetical protein